MGTDREMMRSLALSLALVCCLVRGLAAVPIGARGNADLPIICIHGYGGYATDFVPFVEWAKEVWPGRMVVSLKMFEGKNSTHPMNEMLEGFISKLAAMPELRDG